MNLLQMLQSGGVLRYRPPHGFYVVMRGKSTAITDAEARAAVSAKKVLPNGIDQHGVYLFALNKKASA